MAESKQGVIEAITKDGRRFKLDDGNWYGCFTPAQLKGERGDVVEFLYEQKEKGGTIYNNVKGNLRVISSMTGGPSAGTPTGASAPTGGSPTRIPMNLLPVQLARERAIIRQNALTNAVAYAEVVRCLEERCMTPEQVVESARYFEAYTSGDFDIEAASKDDDDVATDDGEAP